MIEKHHQITRSIIIRAALLMGVTALLPGCSLILGGEQPVDTKSHGYAVVRLDRESTKEWQRIQTDVPEVPGTEEGDVAFEHKQTGTIISLNSVCGQTRETSLEELSKYLLLGIDTRGPIEAHEIEIDNAKALASTVEATMPTRKPSDTQERNEEATRPVRIQAVVLRKGPCTYDLMYIARPEVFETHRPTFERFMKGFHAD